MISYSQVKMSPNDPVRILSIDGGGVRGITSAMLIAEIEKRTNRKAVELFDIITGVSIGSLIGAALENNYSGDKIVSDWEKNAIAIFQRSTLRTVSTIDGLIAPKWSLDNLIQVTTEYFGDKLLKDCPTEFVCPALETTHDEPWYFSRNTANSIPTYADITIRDAVVSSSAAPGYFRSYKKIIHDQELNFIDGAVFAANPTDVAYSCGGQSENSLVLSLGTGRRTNSLTYTQTAQMGFLSWAIEGQLFDMILQSNAQNTHDLMERLLKEKYFRWQTNLDQNIKMDDVESIPYLKAVTYKYIGDNDKQIQKTCDAFAAASKR